MLDRSSNRQKHSDDQPTRKYKDLAVQNRRPRMLIYSHDSFGLGHLRRCRTIAHSLVDHREDLSVLILSGSPIIGSFGFRERVDFVRIPGVIKLRHGDYSSLKLDMNIDDVMAMRASIIQHTADVFKPDVFLVDKEPLGLRGEVKDTLTMLKARGTPLVLGLRDIIDAPEVLDEEWRRKDVYPALDTLYDHIWVYGLPGLYDPFEKLKLSDAVRKKSKYTGYLRRTWNQSAPRSQPTFFNNEPYILVNTGGGGDGDVLVDWVLRAYEHDPGIAHPSLLLLGPFMRSSQQAEFIDRVSRLEKVEVITFETNVESLVSQAMGIVSMGGYNNFCEILSFDKRGLIVPRMAPRQEQHIRARRAEELGLARMLLADGDRSPVRMADALRALPQQSLPSDVRLPGILDGLSTINGIVDSWLEKEPRQQTGKQPGLTVISGKT